MRKEDKIKRHKERVRNHGDKKPPHKHCPHCGGEYGVHVPFCPVTQ